MILAALLLTWSQIATAIGGATEQPTTVIFVRHAEKAVGDAKDPGLSAQGQARAGALAKALADTKVGTVIVSDTKRARETADLVAKDHGLTPVEVAVAGGGEEHAKGVVAAIRNAAPGSTVLVVGHSNTLAPVIAALGGPQVAALCEKQFAPLYVLELSDPPKLVTKSYGAPDPPGAENCAQ